MKLSATKMNLFAGIGLLVLAAFFSITLITQPLDYLSGGTAQVNGLWYIGNMLYSVYGLSSILIPVFFLIAGLSCFASNWTARRSMRLLTAVVPFFTAVFTESICRGFLAYPSEYNGIKLAVTIFTGLAMMVIEFLAAGVLADKVNDKYFNANGSLKKHPRPAKIRPVKLPKAKKIKADKEIEIEDITEEDADPVEGEVIQAQAEQSPEETKTYAVFEEALDTIAQDIPEVETFDAKEEPELFEMPKAMDLKFVEDVETPDETESTTEPEPVTTPEPEANNIEESEETHDYSSASSLITQEEFSALIQSDPEDELTWDNLPPAPAQLPPDYLDDEDMAETSSDEPGTDPDEMELPDDMSAPAKPEQEMEMPDPMPNPMPAPQDDPYALANDLDTMKASYEPEEETVWANEDAYRPFADFEDEDEPEDDDEGVPGFYSEMNQAPVSEDDAFAAFDQEPEEMPVEAPYSEPTVESAEVEDEPETEDMESETAKDPSVSYESDESFEPEVNEPFETADETFVSEKEVSESENANQDAGEDRSYGTVTDTGTFNIAQDIFSDMDAEVRAENELDPLPANPFGDAKDLTADELTAFFNAQQAANTPNTQKIEGNLPKSNRAQKKGPYQIPSDLLTEYVNDQYWIIDDETKAASLRLKETLSEFGIEAEITGIKKGPVITMFELLPASGVKLSKIVGLQDNIALSLAAQSVRIVAPIPGKQAVGIEVPNKDRSIVGFRELIEQPLEEFKKMAVPVILGKDILGKSQIMDLVKTPHLLIAGATGAGKSVCVNSIILSILYKRSPQDVKMILIDPKVVELKLYNNIPHLLTPVITEPKKAFQALQYCLCEMERRYALLDNMGVRDISNYNRKIVEKKICTEKLPYMVVIIDEFADLMATTGKQLESTVARLAAMSRAVGIHLVLATQRPSVNVITGLIKANIPSRIAFMVASRTDSSIIIDSPGAEKLLGRGDMLYASAVDPYPVRIQGTFVSDQEVENVVEYVKQYGEPDYIDDQIFIDDEDEGQGELFDENDDLGEDPLWDQALEVVVQSGKASASYIQRRLKIGYNRAARLVEEMEERGIVGPANGSKPREIIHIP